MMVSLSLSLTLSSRGAKFVTNEANWKNKISVKKKIRMQRVSASTTRLCASSTIGVFCSRRRGRRTVVVAAAVNGSENSGVLVEIARYFTRPLKCQTCFGYNRVICVVCRGRGTDAFFFPSEGEKTTRASFCEKCNGRGYVGCDACNRTGLKNGWLFVVKGGWGSRGE